MSEEAAIYPPYTCPCCGYLMYEEPPGSYDICKICFWEDDLVQLRDVRFGGGANIPNLITAQQMYQEIGASEERLLKFVISPKAEHRRDPRWHIFNPEHDEMSADDGTAWARDPLAYYYWLHPR